MAIYNEKKKGELLVSYSQKAVNDFHKRRYYHIGVNIPLEYKGAVQSAAAARGVSVSRFISDLVGRELGVDLALDGVLPYLQGRDNAAQSDEKPD